jgi:hypothetical protein
VLNPLFCSMCFMVLLLFVLISFIIGYVFNQFKIIFTR